MRKPTVESLANKLWRTVSRYVCLRDKGICISCLKKGDPSSRDTHAGHFVHAGRSKHKLLYIPRLDKINLNCQCAGCNTFKHGELGEYAMALNRKYKNFDEIHKEIKREKMKPKDPTIKQLQNQIKHYEDLIDYYKNK